MTTNPGISIEDAAAVDAWLASLPEKELPELVRDQLILLNAIHQSLVHLQRGQIRLQASLDEIAELQTEEAPVRVTDADLPFTSMVVLIIKWTLATVPAALILASLAALIVYLLRVLGWIGPVFGF